MGGKFDREHFGIERNVVAYPLPAGPCRLLARADEVIE
jgi:hypothetical protein